MVYGSILKEGEKYYTYLGKVFDAIGNRQKEYNWLVTNCECYPMTQEFNKMFDKDYCWLSGDELTSIINTEDFQWIWAVLSGFSKDISLAKVLESPLPFADGYSGFWKNPVSIQHPFASIEIVPFDSSLILLISDQKGLIDDFKKIFHLSEDLSLYNAT